MFLRGLHQGLGVLPRGLPISSLKKNLQGQGGNSVVKALSAKADYLSSSSGSTWWKEQSGSHTCLLTCTHVPRHVRTHFPRQKINNFITFFCVCTDTHLPLGIELRSTDLAVSTLTHGTISMVLFFPFYLVLADLKFTM